MKEKLSQKSSHASNRNSKCEFAVATAYKSPNSQHSYQKQFPTRHATNTNVIDNYQLEDDKVIEEYKSVYEQVIENQQVLYQQENRIKVHASSKKLKFSFKTSHDDYGFVLE